jgi:hypothetical protein
MGRCNLKKLNDGASEKKKNSIVLTSQISLQLLKTWLEKVLERV